MAVASRLKSPIRGSLATKEAIWFYILIAPWIGGFILFTAGPILASVFLSFNESTSGWRAPGWPDGAQVFGNANQSLPGHRSNSGWQRSWRPADAQVLDNCNQPPPSHERPAGSPAKLTQLRRDVESAIRFQPATLNQLQLSLDHLAISAAALIADMEADDAGPNCDEDHHCARGTRMDMLEQTVESKGEEDPGCHHDKVGDNSHADIP